ncbi:hypothetical protein [Clostridium kluyveri]|uniref:hypothetical protein n=1 Tax=Clostridium kluyveri TaxID=1534 RepID=UPI001A988D60|nr:hypothetical protein [Clostridium kluyveri]
MVHVLAVVALVVVAVQVVPAVVLVVEAVVGVVDAVDLVVDVQVAHLAVGLVQEIVIMPVNQHQQPKQLLI